MILAALLVNFTTNMAKNHSAAGDEVDSHHCVRVLYRSPTGNSGGEKNQAETLSRTSGIGSERCSCWLKW